MRKALMVILLLLVFPMTAGAAPHEHVDSKERCAVCGMMVAKYPQWVSQLHVDEKVLWFDGVKDMMAYYFEPAQYGGSADAKINAAYVKDYYSQKWIDGMKAVYVTGSDVLGPMGHEFIPFESMDAAENFAKDHGSKMILPFKGITSEMVKKMKGGHKMKKMKMKKQ